MPGFSDYWARKVIDRSTANLAIGARTALYIGLYTVAPSDAGGGTEAAGGSYARVQIAGSVATNAPTAAGSAVLNFAATPAWVTVGMAADDGTTAGVIPAGAKVLSKTSTTVTLDQNITGGGVLNGDSIFFSAFGSAAGSAPALAQNSSVVTFPAATADWGTCVAFGVFDASSAGNLIWWDYLGSYAWLPVYITQASPGVFDAKAHGFNAADTVVFTTEYGGTAPTFSQSNLTGLLAVVGPTTDTFTVTNAATAVNTSSTGSGMVRKVGSQSIPSGVTFFFSVSSLSLSVA